ncbi:PREDICTED: transcription factor MYB57-like [Nelumbo nucifera]|uniref:Transcription factor MYB57-like n=1 Tax=Nelumbo nucifera TaxID=4432 RepID=A0A1U8Q642_NELNU|nr:PREDICTED: transcription factor MYB57-like [Nelumbo nucifera]
MEGKKDEVVMRKGPWMAEEDEILLDYVKKYGPRDWSSIRSKGLLPRTVEEERVVIDLQAKFGNKWARIATYLPGRTDNDVKNFWSTRQKRLARILQTSQPCKSQKNNGKSSVLHEIPPLEFAEPVIVASDLFQAPKFSSTSVEEVSSSSSSKDQNFPPSYMENSEVIKMVPLPDLVNPNLLNLGTNNLTQLEYTPMEKKPCVDPLSQFPFPQLPQPPLDLPLPLLPESQELADTNLLNVFSRQMASEPDEDGPQLPLGLLSFGSEVNSQNSGRGDDNPAMPDSYFDDFPTDMFDYLEQFPSSSEW